jgi:hypothetical protein
MSNIHWGDFPTWAAATGTVGALWFLAVGQRRESRKWRIEREEQTISPARLVTSESSLYSTQYSDPKGFPFDIIERPVSIYNHSFNVTITNDSDGPILNVEVRILRYPDDPGSTLPPVIEPTTTRDGIVRIPQHSERGINCDFTNSVRTSTNIWPQIIYTDARGRRWSRIEGEEPESFARYD